MISDSWVKIVFNKFVKQAARKKIFLLCQDCEGIPYKQIAHGPKNFLGLPVVKNFLVPKISSVEDWC